MIVRCECVEWLVGWVEWLVHLLSLLLCRYPAAIKTHLMSTYNLGNGARES
jgi:hypothetical protein